MLSSSKSRRPSSPPSSLMSSPPWRRDVFLVWYLGFGILHELAHLLAGEFLGYDGSFAPLDLFALIFGRACSIPGLEKTKAEDWEIAFIRHTGWIASVLIFVVAAVVGVENRRCCCYNSPWIWAAFVTAMEGIATDLVSFNYVSKTTFLCGNFGVILLNPTWTTTPGDCGKTALDLLEKMIEITMMRGAQTGGVVTWISGNKKELTPIRVRVVNGKRTDLSEQLRKALNRQVCSGRKINPSIRCLLGHTRFATSSKATIDGTHPHQWSPTGRRSIYPLDDSSLWSSSSPKPVTQMVTNYITHNGDLDFIKLNGVHADLEAVQSWLEKATGYPMPAPVDSAAIAGLVDLIRCGGCFALSLRFARVIACESASVTSTLPFPSLSDYAKLGEIFEMWLPQFCLQNNVNLRKIKSDTKRRASFMEFMVSKTRKEFDFANSAFTEFSMKDEKDIEQSFPKTESRYSLKEFVGKTIDAFFDNDLFYTTKFFMTNAVGSFGLMVTSSMDAKSQICIAARGQPMSVAFFPQKGIICYGSELAAVKAGMMYDNPAGKLPRDNSSSSFQITDDMTQETCRFDLDDLGGEVVLLDFGSKKATVMTHQESFTSNGNMRSRITPLQSNEFLIPLTTNVDDQILDDIDAIPRALDSIQKNWKEGGLNRMTAWNLGRHLKQRLQDKFEGKDLSSIDVLVTGCEVSLYVAEQFASDLQKSFPKLNIQALSSNKILGVFGQELAVPSVGFPASERIPDLQNSVVVIVSHSGGTFGPLAISNLLQSVTKKIFVVASEWDTQIGKQLRSMFSQEKDIFASRVFTTDIGVRPSEPCSLSVCATHQLLTQIFEHICMVILSDHRFRSVAGAVITHQDLAVLERCNIENILAMERITATDLSGSHHETEVNRELKAAGDLWADHILENARAYILSFLYIVGTVTAGYPLITGLAIAAGMTAEYGFYITRFFDSLIYFFMPQINVTLIRLIQQRNLLHRMTGRTVVIGDIPWVSQCADAFLSKIFARSYSIAGLNVLSGNPADHLVHRHTHRVTRGTLLVCGRPDGRLTALTSAECSVNLSVNQASSIQSLGGTCESITIGHNPAKLHLTKRDIALGTHRPKFLCEQILDIMDDETARKQHALSSKVNGLVNTDSNERHGFLSRFFGGEATSDNGTDDQSILNRSSHSLKGAYLGLRQLSEKQLSLRSITEATNLIKEVAVNDTRDDGSTDNPEVDTMLHDAKKASKNDQILITMIEERSKVSELRSIFEAMDTDGNGTIDIEEFVAAYQKINPGFSVAEIESLFYEADVDGSGSLSYAEFSASMMLDGADVIRKLHHAARRDERGLLQVEPSQEDYFGADLHAAAKPGITSFAQAHSQHFAMELYESRIASLQRFIAMCVMFHRMGSQVQAFFPKYSFGIFGYKINRTHSIMRIATTASPISGDAVREQMEYLRIRAAFMNAVQMILNTWHKKQQRKIQELREQYLRSPSPRRSTRFLNFDNSAMQDSKNGLKVIDFCGDISTEKTATPDDNSLKEKTM